MKPASARNPPNREILFLDSIEAMVIARLSLYHKRIMIIGMTPEVRAYLSRIGRKGGLKSRRRLDPSAARDMVRLREARRAYRRFHARCFWSFDPEYRIGPGDVAWVAEQLKKHGGWKEWEVARKLCL